MSGAHEAAAARNQDASVFVGGLDGGGSTGAGGDGGPVASEALLWELFSQVAPVVSVFMPKDKVSGGPAGFAFVELASEADATYAAKVLNMVRLHGRLLRVSKAGQGALKPGAAGASLAPPREGDVGANLFIGGLSPEIDEKAIYDVFSAFGHIPSTPRVLRDAATNAPRGCGFVSFDSFEAADLAIEAMNGQFLGGRQLSVMYAFRKDGSGGERHGSAAERALAAAARARAPTSAAPARPNLLYATAAGGAVVSAVPPPAAGSLNMLGAAPGAHAPPPMLPPAAILPSGAPPSLPQAALLPTPPPPSMMMMMNSQQQQLQQQQQLMMMQMQMQQQGGGGGMGSRGMGPMHAAQVQQFMMMQQMAAMGRPFFPPGGSVAGGGPPLPGSFPMGFPQGFQPNFSPGVAFPPQMLAAPLPPLVPPPAGH